MENTESLRDRKDSQKDEAKDKRAGDRTADKEKKSRLSGWANSDQRQKLIHKSSKMKLITTRDRDNSGSASVTSTMKSAKNNPKSLKDSKDKEQNGKDKK